MVISIIMEMVLLETGTNRVTEEVILAGKDIEEDRGTTEASKTTKISPTPETAISSSLIKTIMAKTIVPTLGNHVETTAYMVTREYYGRATMLDVGCRSEPMLMLNSKPQTMKFLNKVTNQVTKASQ